MGCIHHRLQIALGLWREQAGESTPRWRRGSGTPGSQEMARGKGREHELFERVRWRQPGMAEANCRRHE